MTSSRPTEARGTASLLLGDGMGFEAAVDFPISMGLAGLVTGDFNGDDKPRPRPGVSAGGASLVLGNGAALFGGPFTIPLAGTSEAIAVLDANEDGALDLAVAQSSLDAVTVLAGNGLGGFAGGVPFLAGMGPVALASADVDRRRPRRSRRRRRRRRLGRGGLLGDGSGNFVLETSEMVGVGPTAVLAADLNGDGALDLAVAADDDSVTLFVSNP